MNKLLTVIQAAELLGIHRISVYKLIYARKIPFIRIKGIGLRFNPDSLEAWAKQSEVEASGHSKKTGD